MPERGAGGRGCVNKGIFCTQRELYESMRFFAKGVGGEASIPFPPESTPCLSIHVPHVFIPNDYVAIRLLIAYPASFAREEPERNALI